MILLQHGETELIRLKCGCRKTRVEADDYGTWARRCNDCKRWTRYTVGDSPTGKYVRVEVEWATDQEVAA